MGLFNSVIADARPAKPKGRLSDATAPLTGRPFHQPKTASGMTDSVPDSSGQAKDAYSESKKTSMFGPSTTLKYDLPSVSKKRQAADDKYLTHGRTDNKSEAGSIVSQNKTAAGSVRHPVNDPIPHTQRNDQPFVEPVSVTESAEAPAFTFFDQNVENTESPQSHSGVDRQADFGQVLTHLPNEESMPARSEGRDVPDGKAEIPVERYDNLDATAAQTTDAVEKSNAWLDGEAIYDAEEKPQPTTSVSHPSLGMDKGYAKKQSVKEVRSAIRQHAPVKPENRRHESRSLPQPEGKDRNHSRSETSGAQKNSGEIVGQPRLMDHTFSARQPTTALTPFFAQPGEKAKSQSLSDTIQQQQHERKSIEKTAEMIEARSIRTIDDQMARYPASEPHGQKKPGFEAPHSAEVKIGRIDVFVEKPMQTTSHGSRTALLSVSLASRHYLRRL